jgi:uncharacterized protein (TIGR02266 family)
MRALEIGSDENRLHPPRSERAGVRIAVTVQPRDAFTVVRGPTSNLSRGGLFMEADHIFAVGEELGVQLDPGDGRAPIDLRAEVAWVRDWWYGEEPPGMAIRFTDLGSDEDQLRLGAVLEPEVHIEELPPELLELASDSFDDEPPATPT